MLAHRYHATIHRRGKQIEQIGEFLVVAANDSQARRKVKQHLHAIGMAEAARGQVITVDIGNARMELDVIY